MQKIFYHNISVYIENDIHKILENYCKLFSIDFCINLIFCEKKILNTLNTEYKRRSNKCTKTLSFLPFMCYDKNNVYFFGDIFMCCTCLCVSDNFNVKATSNIVHSALHNIRRKHTKTKERYNMLKIENILVSYILC